MVKPSSVGLCVLVASLLAWSGQSFSETISITARNDVPGPVTAILQLRDSADTVLLSEKRTWTKNDNTFSVETWIVPDDIFDEAEDGGVLRITFIGDEFTQDGPDLDRNLYIDNLDIDGDFREGEDFDNTGGTDMFFPGCGGTMVVDGRTVADCGNEDDFVEYRLDEPDHDD